jgi:hypothetical protein
MSMPPQQRPPGWQQGPWPPQPPPPLPDFAPDKKNSVKWLLITVAVLLVVGVTIGATLYFTRDNGGTGSTATSSAVPSDVASANDTGPVAIISDEPTCPAFIDIYNALADVQSQGWNQERRTLGSASDWTPDQRSHVEAVVTALRNAADQIVALAKGTPHRVIRELYEQFIAYGRAYADAAPDYTAGDGYLAGTNVAIGNTLKGICNSITYKSHTRSLAIPRADSPSSVAAVGNPADPHRFLTLQGSTCSSWIANDGRFNAGTADWENLDPNVPGSQWTPEQRAIALASLPAFNTLANDMESTGRQSGNPVLEDFAVLGALYLRAYVSAGDSYAPADSWLSFTGLRINNTVAAACQQPGN